MNTTPNSDPRKMNNLFISQFRPEKQAADTLEREAQRHCDPFERRNLHHAAESPITLTFEEFALDDNPDCKEEFLSISNFDWARFCGEEVPATIETSETTVTVTFASDGNRSVNGDRRFRISYDIGLECEPGWVKFRGQCYYFGSTDRPDFGMLDADEACHDMGANVTSIHSREEDEFVASKVKASFSLVGGYTGLGFPNDTFDFEFLDGSAADYQNFNDVGMRLDPYSWIVVTVDEWMNFPCDDLRSFVCEVGDSLQIWHSNGTFDAARSDCISSGGDLIAIKDRDRRASLMETILDVHDPLPREFWIGLKLDVTGDWTWVDGSQVTYANWATGYPLPGRGSCAAAVPSTWATVGSWAFGWSCKKPARRHGRRNSWSTRCEEKDPGRHEILDAFAVMKSLVILWSLLAGVFGEGRQQCGGTLMDGWGVIKSPSYPNEYPVDLQCLWTISAGSPITLTFEEFSLDDNPDCTEEFLRITNFDWAVFCGGDVPRSISTSDSIITIIFKSDGAASGEGDRRFRIYYETDGS
ncbi:unnamed protein product [Darwinula stevensoni]|uniref:Uncharacterized protein n=1 Tax=Darwinula stevensoni TaxID=69355 RepID=A0A7R9FT93_9CRUS|nr:unnamed protein product [Darwinula stevensoni]CAG0904749.1 unnamed protein product [Darwinula stevensoni]